MANWIPESIVIKPMTRTTGAYAYYMNESAAVHGFVRCNERSVFSESARIDIDRAKEVPRYIHIRFRHTNKYWSQQDDGWIVAVSDKPEEDTSNQSCTLFDPIVVGQGRFMLLHVHTGRYVITDTTQTGNLSNRLSVFAGSLAQVNFNDITFDFVNWQSLFKLPPRVAFRGANERWLRGVTLQTQPHLQFSSTDPNDRESVFEIELNDDGHIRIKSAHLNRYLRRNGTGNWLLADAAENNRVDDTLFWPVLVSGSNYAIRSKGSNNFLRLLTADNRTDCLSASAPTMSNPATFLMQELVQQRHMYHTRFRMDQVQVFNERTIIAGTGTSINNSDSPSTLTIRVTYEEKRSYSFINSTSTTVGITSTISSRFLELGQSSSTTRAFEWGETVEETTEKEASVEVTVPPRSGVRVDYVGTVGTSSIPFNYSQLDKSSTDGMYTTTTNTDGIFQGVNYYSIHFEQHPVVRLEIPPPKSSSRSSTNNSRTRSSTKSRTSSSRSSTNNSRTRSSTKSRTSSTKSRTSSSRSRSRSSSCTRSRSSSHLIDVIYCLYKGGFFSSTSSSLVFSLCAIIISVLFD